MGDDLPTLWPRQYRRRDLVPAVRRIPASGGQLRRFISARANPVRARCLATAVVLSGVGALIGRAEESLELANELLTELSRTRMRAPV